LPNLVQFVSATIETVCHPADKTITFDVSCHMLHTATICHWQHLRPSGLFSSQPHSLELTPRFHPGPDHTYRLY